MTIQETNDLNKLGLEESLNFLKAIKSKIQHVPFYINTYIIILGRKY